MEEFRGSDPRPQDGSAHRGANTIGARTPTAAGRLEPLPDSDAARRSAVTRKVIRAATDGGVRTYRASLADAHATVRWQ